MPPGRRRGHLQCTSLNRPALLRRPAAGAACRGGSDVSSLPDFWRADAASSTFHPCKARGVCEATNATGDAACAPGQQGPLCDVCWQGYFKFAGACRWVAAATPCTRLYALRHG